MARCRSCGAPILWAVTEASGKRIPLDAEEDGAAKEVPDGNLLIVDTRAGTPVVRVTAVGQHLSHFATCPQASTHRKKAKR
jgi:hypothetical protein